MTPRTAIAAVLAMDPYRPGVARLAQELLAYSANEDATSKGTRWTEEKIADLKRYYERGLSSGQIAMKLGPNFNRNAVIGKIHRLGLQRVAAERRTHDD